MTLIELLVTLTVIGILVAIAVPAMGAFLSARAVEAQAQELASTLRMARSEALKRGSEVSVCASSTAESATPTCAGNTQWNTGWIAFQDYDNSGTQGTLDGNDKLLRAQSAVKGANAVTTTTQSITMGRNGIVLLANGAALAANATVSFVFTTVNSDATAARTVCLNRQGRVSVARGTIACA